MILLRLLGWLGLPSWFAPLIIVAAITTGVTGAYIKGRLDSSASCREAALQAALQSMARDKKAAEQAEADAVKRAGTLAAEAAKREKEVAAYEQELRRRADKCDLTPDDVNRLRGDKPKAHAR